MVMQDGRPLPRVLSPSAESCSRYRLSAPGNYGGVRSCRGISTRKASTASFARDWCIATRSVPSPTGCTVLSM